LKCTKSGTILRVSKKKKISWPKIQAVENRALCISIEMVEVAFFVTGLETLQILGVEMSNTG
jgi:hypothetical protein